MKNELTTLGSVWKCADEMHHYEFWVKKIWQKHIQQSRAGPKVTQDQEGTGEGRGMKGGGLDSSKRAKVRNTRTSPDQTLSRSDGAELDSFRAWKCGFSLVWAREVGQSSGEDWRRRRHSINHLIDQQFVFRFHALISFMAFLAYFLLSYLPCFLTFFISTLISFLKLDNSLFPSFLISFFPSFFMSFFSSVLFFFVP